MNKKIEHGGNPTEKENELRNHFFELFKKNPMPENEVLANLALFIKSKDMKRMLFMHELYKKILDVNGIVVEFGSRWGQNLALFESFRGIYEPFNLGRIIVGFDTFEGFNSVHKNDQVNKNHTEGEYSVPDNYEHYLNEILEYHEQENPISHLKKFQIIKGDAPVKLKEYLEKNPQTIIALAYFDMDLYQPTKECLEIIKKYVTKGSVIGFDELNAEVFPGETTALKEVFGLDKFRLKRDALCSRESYLVIE